jgi:hypothetical protein
VLLARLEQIDGDALVFLLNVISPFRNDAVEFGFGNGRKLAGAIGKMFVDSSEARVIFVSPSGPIATRAFIASPPLAIMPASR